jgi:type I restriction enzyme R subunit
MKRILLTLLTIMLLGAACTIARELVKTVRGSASVDWNLKESVRASMRARVRRLLAKYDYPPDKEERAITLVLEQAEVFAGSTLGAN